MSRRYVPAPERPTPEQRRADDRLALSHANILAIQRSAGNQAVARYLATQRPSPHGARRVARDDGPPGGAPPAPVNAGPTDAGAPPGGAPVAPSTSPAVVTPTGGAGGTQPALPGGAASTDAIPAVVPSEGVLLTLSDGMDFPLETGDLSDLELGMGRKSAETLIPDTPWKVGISVGANSPLRLSGVRLHITPLKVRIKREEIEARRKEKEDATTSVGKAGAAVGGVVGGLVGAGLLGPIPALAFGGPLGGTARGGVTGGQLGESAVAAWMSEQKLSATVEEGGIQAHFPFKYAPYLELTVGVVTADEIVEGWGHLQTSLTLDFAPKLSLAKSALELYFKEGRFSRASFTLALTGGLDLAFDATARLSAGLRFFRSLGGQKAGEDPGLLSIPLFQSPVFDLIENATAGFEVGTTIDFATGSALKPVTHTAVKANGAGGASFGDKVFREVAKRQLAEQFERYRGEAKKVKKGEIDADDHGFHTGREEDPILFDYWKPLEDYRPYLLYSKGTKQMRLDNWPHQEYKMVDDADEPPRGAERKWAVGVDDRFVPRPNKTKGWVRTKPGSRAQANKWLERAKAYNIDVTETELDHVQDLALGGEDDAMNLWPLPKGANANAGKSMYEQPVKVKGTSPDMPDGTYSLGSLPVDTHLKIRSVVKKN